MKIQVMLTRMKTIKQTCTTVIEAESDEELQDKADDLCRDITADLDWEDLEEENEMVDCDKTEPA